MLSIFKKTLDFVLNLLTVLYNLRGPQTATILKGLFRPFAETDQMTEEHICLQIVTLNIEIL